MRRFPVDADATIESLQRHANANHHEVKPDRAHLKLAESRPATNQESEM